MNLPWGIYGVMTHNGSSAADDVIYSSSFIAYAISVIVSSLFPDEYSNEGEILEAIPDLPVSQEDALVLKDVFDLVNPEALVRKSAEDLYRFGVDFVEDHIQGDPDRNH